MMNTKDWFTERNLRFVRAMESDDKSPPPIVSEADLHQLLTEAQQLVTEGLPGDDKEKVWNDFQRFFYLLTSYKDSDHPLGKAVNYRSGQELVEFISNLSPEEREPYLAYQLDHQLATVEHTQLCASVRQLYEKFMSNPKDREQVYRIREEARYQKHQLEVFWQEHPEFKEADDAYGARNHLIIIEGDKKTLIDEFGRVFYNEYRAHLGE